MCYAHFIKIGCDRRQSVAPLQCAQQENVHQKYFYSIYWDCLGYSPARSRYFHGAKIVLCLHDSIDFPSAFLGAIKAGIVPVSIDAVLSTRDYDVMLRDSRAQVLVVSQALLGTFQPRKTNAGLDLAPFVYTPRLLHHEIQTGSIHATPVAIVHNGVSSN